MSDRLARALYTGLWILLTPVLLGHLAWRARKQPEYLRNIGERFGRYRPRRTGRRTLLIHAVSVGETRAAEPLVRALAARYPQFDLVISHTTPTGRAVPLNLPGTVTRVYFPYDFPGAVARLLWHFDPALVVLMETEVWPNLLVAAESRQIPVALVNARLSARSLRRAQRYLALMRGAVRRLDLVIAQTDADAARIAALGARRIEIAGNLKFDQDVPESALALGRTFRQRFGARRVFLAASTREGEESLLLDAWRGHGDPRALLVIVPRHPQRFAEVGELVAARGFSVAKRSDEDGAVVADVFLGDSMGEMMAYYASADVAYVGGGLLPFGTHNLIEACAVGCPVLLGPHVFNFAEAARLAIDAQAALQCDDAASVVDVATRLMHAPERLATMAACGLAFARAHRGATAHTLRSLDSLLPSAAAEH